MCAHAYASITALQTQTRVRSSMYLFTPYDILYLPFNHMQQSHNAYQISCSHLLSCIALASCYCCFCTCVVFALTLCGESVCACGRRSFSVQERSKLLAQQQLLPSLVAATVHRSSAPADLPRLTTSSAELSAPIAEPFA
jgi:hypothetical protein